MTDWKKTTLGQVAQVFTGFPFKSNDYSEDPHDIKLLRGDNIAQGTLRWDDAKTWPKTECEKYVQYQLKEDDVVLAMDRPWIGAGLKYSSVRKEDLPSLLVQRTARLRGSAELDIIYLKYIIASPWFSKYIQSINTGSLVPHISSKQIKDFPINLPPLPQQKKLSSVLAALDKKIDVNNFINAELEAMAKTLYDYWFVQFEFPDANGKPYKTSGGKMEYNATLKREVPAGWDIRNLGDIAELYQPKTISGNDFIEDGEYLVYGANGIIGRFDKYNHEESVVTITCRGNTCGNINVTRPYSWVTGNAMVVKPKYKYLSPYYIYNLLSISEINKVITGSAQPQITRANLAPLKVVEPAEDIMQKYSKSFDAFFKKHIAILDENDKLLKLRDWLLPLFMNGQVTIK